VSLFAGAAGVRFTHRQPARSVAQEHGPRSLGFASLTASLQGRSRSSIPQAGGEPEGEPQRFGARPQYRGRRGNVASARRNCAMREWAMEESSEAASSMDWVLGSLS